LAEHRLYEIAGLLLERTESGDIKWEKTATKDEFQTSFAKYSLVIKGGSTRASPELQLFDEDRDLIEELTGARGIPSIEILHLLFECARRRALGADKALDEILEALRTTRKK